MLETVILSGGFVLLGALLTVWLNHRFKVAREHAQRRKELQTMLRAVLFELSAARGCDALLNRGGSRSWGPISASGLTELSNKGLLSYLSPRLQENLREIYRHFQIINSAVSKTGHDEDHGAFRPAFQIDPVEQAVNPIRKPCLDAIKACIPEIEKLLGEMARTDRKST